MAPTNTQTHMTEQTTLNAEQEAFLAYQAASHNRQEANKKVNDTFAVYSDLSDDARKAFEKYTEIREQAQAAYCIYTNSCKEGDSAWAEVTKLYNEWVNVRGY